MRILKRGDTGSDVKLAQTALERAGYDPGAVNGVFGAQTERAVKQFQRVLGAKEDGIIGPVTWKYLEPFANEPDPEVLRRGSRGNAVKMLQNALKAAGYDPGTIDGLFGTKTQAALKAYQKKAGLPETGVADAATWLAIAPFFDYSDVYLRRGDRGMLVMILQNALKNAGFTPGTIDGVFGPRTLAALTAFQKDKGLVADGVAGPKTFAKLKPYMTAGVIAYTVRKGDTLSSIAKLYNTTVAELLKLNPRSDPDKIYVGETIYVPVKNGDLITPAAEDAD